MEPIKKTVPKIVPVLKSQSECQVPLQNELIDNELIDKKDVIKKIKSQLAKADSPTNDMDYTVKISIPSLSDLHREIYTQIQSNVYNIVGETLVSISKDMGIPLDKLQEQYLAPLKIIMDTNMEQLDKAPTAAKKSKKQVDTTALCLARTSTGTQCSRKRQVNVEFCGSHLTTQPYGRMDQPISQEKMLRKRGRPPKPGSEAEKNANNSETLGEIDPISDKDEIVQVKFEIREINDTTYIVDENGNIYEPPVDTEAPDDSANTVVDIENLVQVGQELSDGTYLWL